MRSQSRPGIHCCSQRKTPMSSSQSTSRNLQAGRSRHEPKKHKTNAFADLTGAEELTQQKEPDVVKAKSEENKARIEMKHTELELCAKKLEDHAERQHEKMKAKEAKMQLLASRQGSSTSSCDGTSPFSHKHTPASTPQSSFPSHFQSNISDQGFNTSSFDFSTPEPSPHSQNGFNSNSSPIPFISETNHLNSNSTPSFMEDLYSDGPAALSGGMQGVKWRGGVDWVEIRLKCLDPGKLF